MRTSLEGGLPANAPGIGSLPRSESRRPNQCTPARAEGSRRALAGFRARRCGYSVLVISQARARAVCAAVLALAACATPPPPPEAAKPPAAVGAVQREIKVGMGQPAVIEALGTPTAISTDTQQREVWTYDKV